MNSKELIESCECYLIKNLKTIHIKRKIKSVLVKLESLFKIEYLFLKIECTEFIFKIFQIYHNDEKEKKK